MTKPQPNIAEAEMFVTWNKFAATLIGITGINVTAFFFIMQAHSSQPHPDAATEKYVDNSINLIKDEIHTLNQQISANNAKVLEIITKLIEKMPDKG